jgi:hypothetical protein
MTKDQAQYIKILREEGHSFSRIGELYRKKYDSSSYGRDLAFDAAALLDEDMDDWDENDKRTSDMG